MLWVASLLALVAGMGELAAAIIVIVLLNGVFAFAQEHQADCAAEQRVAMVPASTRVCRGGVVAVVPVVGLVRDDVVLAGGG